MEFSFDTINDFDAHIERSIPDYALLRNSVLHLSDYFILPNHSVYDVGCSTGKLLMSLHKKHPNIKMIGIDNSDNLLPAHDEIIFQCHDLNTDYSFGDASLIISLFTLQFLNKKARLPLLRNMRGGLCTGGALIIAEKVYCDDGITQDMFTSAYYQYKEKSFTPKEILDKEKSLRGLLHPLTTEDNHELLHLAGFHKIITFYKYFNFEAYLCIV